MYQNRIDHHRGELDPIRMLIQPSIGALEQNFALYAYSNIRAILRDKMSYQPSLTKRVIKAEPNLDLEFFNKISFGYINANVLTRLKRSSDCSVAAQNHVQLPYQNETTEAR